MGGRTTIYLVDVSNYIFRAYHAIRSLSNSAGVPTNATFGLTQMLLKLVDDVKPSHLAIVRDLPGGTFRDDLYPAYKAHRPPMPPDLVVQLPYIEQVIAGLRLPVISMSRFEADDVMAALTAQAVRDGHHVVLVSSDKDLMQLVGPGVTMLDTMSDRTYTPEEVRAKWGVPPEQIVDLLALLGDATDNVPGVKGIGQKGAAELLTAFGSLDGIYARLDDVKGKKREYLVDGRDSAFLSRELVTLRTDVPVPLVLDDLALREPDAAALHVLFRELGFRRLQDRFPAREERGVRRSHVVADEAALRAAVAQVEARGEVALALETAGTPSFDADIVGIALAVDAVEAWYVPLGRRGPGGSDPLPLASALEVLAPVFVSPAIRRYVHDHKTAFAALKRQGLVLGAVAFDPMLAGYLLDSDGGRHGLADQAAAWLNHRMAQVAEEGRGAAQGSLQALTPEAAADIACEPAHVTYRLVAEMRPRLEGARLGALLTDVELPLSRVIARMEEAGLAVDVERLHVLSRSFAERMVRLEREAHDLAGFPFNLGSPKQLAEVLFDRLKLPCKRHTKTGRSTDSAVLEGLAESHALPAKVLEWRTVQKLRSTYSDALSRLVHPRTGRIHCSLNQAVAATGRLSSSDPNLQNIPIRTEEGREIRKAFVAGPGHVLVSADYSQIELRVLAHLSEDDALLAAFRDDADVHTRTAAEIYGTAPAEVTREQRARAKAINFGLVYGMGASRLARDVGIERKEAQATIERYFARYAGVKRYLELTLDVARSEGEVRTLLGRRRLLPDIQSPNPQTRAFAERTAINTPVQGSAADIIKLAMLRVQAKLDESRLASRMIMQIHDELLFEVPTDELERLTALVREGMEGAYGLRVPLRVDIHSGSDWSAAHG